MVLNGDVYPTLAYTFAQRVNFLYPGAIIWKKVKNIYETNKAKGTIEMQVGTYGICCDTCGLKIKGIREGRAPGDSPEAVRKAEFLQSINALCPVLDCAAKKENSVLLQRLQGIPLSNIRKGISLQQGVLGDA